MKDHNTITGFHFRIVNGQMKINPKKYNWHIPKCLRYLNIEPGDIVLASSRKSKQRILVIDTFREDIEDTGRRYKNVQALLEKAPVNQAKEQVAASK